VAISITSKWPSRVRSSPMPAPSSLVPLYDKLLKLRNGAVGDAENAGSVHDRSAVPTLAPPVTVSGSTAAVHTSNGERKRLKFRTSRLFLPSRNLTLTAFAAEVGLTIDSKVAYALPKPSA